MSGSLKTGGQMVQGGTEPADGYTFFHENGNADHHLGTGFIVHKGIASTVKSVGCHIYY
jgi:hypothetical protein